MSKTSKILINILFFFIEMFFIWSCARGMFYDFRAGEDGWAALNALSLVIWAYLLCSHAESVPKQFAEAKLEEEKKKKEQQKEESKDLFDPEEVSEYCKKEK